MKIFAANFKGQAFEREFGPKTLVIGPNGAGKSVATQALQLMLLGYVPSEKPAKTNQDIFDAFSTGREMTVGVDLGAGPIFRVFRKASKGSVSQKLRVGRNVVGKEDFGMALADAPRLFDLATFTELSDNKKLEMLLSLYPPSADVDRLLAEIISANRDLLAKQEVVRSTEKAIGQLAKQRSEIELPSGTLAEVRADIALEQKSGALLTT